MNYTFSNKLHRSVRTYGWELSCLQATVYYLLTKFWSSSYRIYVYLNPNQEHALFPLIILRNLEQC